MPKSLFKTIFNLLCCCCSKKKLSNKKVDVKNVTGNKTDLSDEDEDEHEDPVNENENCLDKSQWVRGTNRIQNQVPLINFFYFELSIY